MGECGNADILRLRLATELSYEKSYIWLLVHSAAATHSKKRDTHLRHAITVKHRLAITLWCLATPAEYRTIAYLFGVGRSTYVKLYMKQ